MFRIRHLAAAAMLLCAAQTVSAKDACEGFKWDVAREHALFLGAATKLTAGSDAASAPGIPLDRLTELELAPQDGIRYAAPASKKMLADGASGGLVRFRAPHAGAYRVAVDVPFWLDVVDAGKTIASKDFNGSPGCDTPRKIVVYELPADTDLLLQFSGATESRVRFTLTAVP